MSNTSLTIIMELWDLGRKTTEVKHRSHDIIPHWSLVMLTDHWLRYCLAGFSTIKLLFFPLSILFSLEGSHHAQYTFKGWASCFTAIWGISNVNHLEFFYMEVLSTLPFSYLFHHLFISVLTHGCLFYIVTLLCLYYILFIYAHIFSIYFMTYYVYLVYFIYIHFTIIPKHLYSTA